MKGAVEGALLLAPSDDVRQQPMEVERRPAGRRILARGDKNQATAGESMTRAVER